MNEQTSPDLLDVSPFSPSLNSLNPSSESLKCLLAKLLKICVTTFSHVSIIKSIFTSYMVSLSCFAWLYDDEFIAFKYCIFIMWGWVAWFSGHSMSVCIKRLYYYVVFILFFSFMVFHILSMGIHQAIFSFKANDNYVQYVTILFQYFNKKALHMFLLL